MKIQNYFKDFNEKLKILLRDYGMILGLLLSIIAVGLSSYNTYILKTSVNGNLPATKKFDKLTNSEIEKIIKGGSPVLGDINAKVTIVEFADFQCPYCGKYFKQILIPLKQKYIETGKVRFVYMNFAFLGEESIFAAEAAKCAQNQDKFWQYHDYLYESQQGENRGVFDNENLKKFAKDLKLDTTKFSECLDSRKYQKAVESETQLAKKFGVTVTPATFINDFYISGLQGLSYFENRIDSALSGK